MDAFADTPSRNLRSSASKMKDKNGVNNGALAQPSTKAFKKTEKTEAPDATLQTAFAPEFDLSRLPSHPAITVVDNKSIKIHIEQCNDMPNQQTDMRLLFGVLRGYVPHVKILRLRIHAPYSDRTWMHGQKTIVLFQKLWLELSHFKLDILFITMLLDQELSSQMDLAAGLFGLSSSKIQSWNLVYEVVGVPGSVSVPHGTEFRLRIEDIYRKEMMYWRKDVKLRCCRDNTRSL